MLIQSAGKPVAQIFRNQFFNCHSRLPCQGIISPIAMIIYIVCSHQVPDLMVLILPFQIRSWDTVLVFQADWIIWETAFTQYLPGDISSLPHSHLFLIQCSFPSFLFPEVLIIHVIDPPLFPVDVSIPPAFDFDCFPSPFLFSLYLIVSGEILLEPFQSWIRIDLQSM